MLPDLLVKSFHVSCKIQKNDEVQALKRMFSDKNVLLSIGLPHDDCDYIDQGALESISCKVLSMSFFQNLVDAGLVSDTGYIRGCYDEEVDGILVQDELRLMCAKDNEGEYKLPSRDRREFIFHLLKLLSIGGAKCQCEDKFQVLNDTIKLIYKELVQVRKDSSDQPKICSSIYEITLGDNSSLLFPHPNNIHNKFYVIMSEFKVTLLIKKFLPFW